MACMLSLGSWLDTVLPTCMRLCVFLRHGNPDQKLFPVEERGSFLATTYLQASARPVSMQYTWYLQTAFDIKSSKEESCSKPTVPLFNHITSDNSVRNIPPCSRRLCILDCAQFCPPWHVQIAFLCTAYFSLARWTCWNNFFLISLIHAHNANIVSVSKSYVQPIRPDSRIGLNAKTMWDMSWRWLSKLCFIDVSKVITVFSRKHLHIPPAFHTALSVAMQKGTWSDIAWAQSKKHTFLCDNCQSIFRKSAHFLHGTKKGGCLSEL